MARVSMATQDIVVKKKSERRSNTGSDSLLVFRS
jgi:hypothetical protein